MNPVVVNTNVLFTFFWKNSVFNKLVLSQHLECLCPERALEEINKYSSDIMKRTKLSETEFNKLKNELFKVLVEPLPFKLYSSSIKEMGTCIENTKGLTAEEKEELLDDIDFLALALKLKCLLWSNDKLLKEQSKVKVINTEEMISLVDKFEKEWSPAQ